MNLEDLKTEIPFKWRVQSTNQYGCTCVAYIDARDVQIMFDSICKPENWQVLYEEHKGNLFAKIGIKKDSEWIWKSDCGTESNIEKQKGESSDAFKRAAVMWGVGRFLYSLDIIKIKEVIKDGTDRNGKDRYSPSLNGNKIWDVNEHCNTLYKNKNRKQALTLEGFKYLIDKGSKEEINTALNGRRMTPQQRKELTAKI